MLFLIVLLLLAGSLALKAITSLTTRCATEKENGHHVEALVTPVDRDDDATTAGSNTVAVLRGAFERLGFVYARKSRESPIRVSIGVLVQSFLGEASVFQLSHEFLSQVKAPWTFTVGRNRNGHQNATIERAIFQEAAFCVPSPGRIWGAKMSSVNNANHGREPAAHVFCVTPLLCRTYSGGNHIACEQIDPVGEIVALSTCPTYLFVATVSEAGSSRTRLQLAIFNLDSESLCTGYTPNVRMRSLLDIMSGVCAKSTQPIIWTFLVRAQSVIASHRTPVAGYGRLRTDTPKIAPGEGLDRNNRGPAMMSIMRMATSRNGEEPATPAWHMISSISSAIYMNPPRPWAERQDIKRASVFCSGAVPSQLFSWSSRQQEIFLITNAGGGIGPALETWILERRPIVAGGRRRLTSSPRGRPPSLPRQNPLPSPSTSGDRNLGFPLRADNGVPVSSSRAIYLLRNQAMVIAPTLHPPPCDVLGVSKKDFARSLNHDAGYGDVSYLKSRVAEIAFCLPRYRICEPYRTAFTDILNHGAEYGHTAHTLGTNGHRESSSQEETNPGRGAGEIETKTPPPSIDRPNGHTRLGSRCSEKAERNGWRLNRLPTVTPPSSRLAAEYPKSTRSESNWSTRLGGVFEPYRTAFTDILNHGAEYGHTTYTFGTNGRRQSTCQKSTSQEKTNPGRGVGEMETKSSPSSIDRPKGHTRLGSRGSEKAERNGWHLNVLPTATPPSSRLAAEYPMSPRSESNWSTRLGEVFERLPRVEKGLLMFESLKMTTNTAGRSGSSSEAEGGLENVVANTSTGDIGSKRKQEAVRVGGASKRPLSDLANRIMPRTMHGIRRRRNQFKHVVRVKASSHV